MPTSRKTILLTVKLLPILYLVILSLHPLCFADLYFWIDAKGVKHYSNSQPEKNKITQLPEIFSNDKESKPLQKVELKQTVASKLQKTVYGPKVNIKCVYYDVIGVNINDLRSETIKQSPIRIDGITFRGRTQWHINPYYEIKQQNDLWYYDNVSATVDIIFTMPKWVDYRKAHRDEQKRWDVFYKALMDHENIHRDIAIGSAKKLCNTLIELESHSGKTELKNIWTIRAKKIYRECRILNKQFDDDTEHGVKTGAIMR